MGGSTLFIETTVVEEGELNIKGHLGDVMKESTQIAHAVARKILLEKEPENLFFANSSFISMFLQKPQLKMVQVQDAP